MSTEEIYISLMTDEIISELEAGDYIYGVYRFQRLFLDGALRI